MSSIVESGLEWEVACDEWKSIQTLHELELVAGPLEPGADKDSSDKDDSESEPEVISDNGD